MGSGFIIGGLWGLIVSAGALAIASLIGEPPRDRAAVPEVLQQIPGTQAITEDGTAVTRPSDAPAEAPTTGTATSTAPAALPEAGSVDTMPQVVEGPTEPSGDPLGEPAGEPLSDVAPPVSAEAPSAPAAQTPLSEAPNAPRPDAGADALPRTPRADVPAGRGDVPVADTMPMQRPRADDAIETPATGPVPPALPRLDAGSEEPVLPGPQSRVIEIPANEADITVVTDPPPAPSAAPREVFDETPAMPGEPDTEGATLPTSSVEEGSGGLSDDAPATQADGAVGSAPPPSVTSERPPLRVPSPPSRPERLPGFAAGTITVLPEPGAPELPGRAAGFQDDSAVVVRRPGAEASEPEPAPAPEFDEDTPALLRFAAPDVAEAGAPRVSVVLIDDGALDDPVAAASSIPFPVTIALDPAMAQAGTRAARWREAGYEIVATTRLPAGATPSDVEVTYESAFATLPETVALLDTGAAGLTSDKAVTAQALERLAQDGRGLAALSAGLATPLRQARGAGVPAIEIYRDLGEVGQDDRVIRRFLDQAAFRARQQGAVALLGQLNPETITALTLWGNRADRDGVVPAPLSALLQMQETGLAK
ncbi:divergent polysaccharide deacetylase family protein [uncultured Limimaricola sp.]|uniref:divergent polysaccharide deacetylase family protein n=1 Tax=uncultured Limimaricola sp. TaxID=2211667 RepID=UPI0030F97C93